MKKLLLASAVITALLFSCKNKEKDSERAKQLAGQLAGTWSNVYVNVKIPDGNAGKGAVTVLEADEHNWEEKLHIKPILTTFKPDSTYTSEYRNLQDSIIRISTGHWYMQGDTLVMSGLENGNMFRRNLWLEVSGDTSRYHGLIDFDGDGNSNDEYTGVQVRRK